MMPIDGLVGRNNCISSSLIRPGLAWGNSEVSERTSADMEATYSIVEPTPWASRNASRLRPAVLGPVPEREQRLGAPGLVPGHGDGQDLFGLEIEATGTGRLGKGAVGAPVPAQRGERDEDLAAVSDHVAMTIVTELGGHLEQRAVIDDSGEIAEG